MKVIVTPDAVTADPAGNVVESVPVLLSDVPVQMPGGTYVDPIAVEEAADGIPVRIVADTAAENSIGEVVDALPVTGISEG